MYHKCKIVELTRRSILLVPNQSVSHYKNSDRTVTEPAISNSLTKRVLEFTYQELQRYILEANLVVFRRGLCKEVKNYKQKVSTD